MPLHKILLILRKISDKFKKNDLYQDGQNQYSTQRNGFKKFLTLRQIKYLPKFLSLKEKMIICAASIIIMICVIMISYLTWKNNLIDKPAHGGVYTEGIVGSPQKINPLYASTNEADRDIASLIFSGLIKFDEEQNIVSDLAKDWFVDEFGTKYTFRLKENIKWPDGKPFTSEDVIFTFGAIQNPDYQSPLRLIFEDVVVEAIDQHTVQFTLPKSFAQFIKNLNVGILPAHLWQDIKPENTLIAELNLKPIGLGPYSFDSYTKDKQGYIKSYTLISNNYYHLNEPFIKQITFKFYPNFELAVDALKNKNIDGLNFLPQNLKESLAARNDINYYSLSLPQYTAIFFNQEKNDLLKINNFRKALDLGIDKDKIISNALSNEAKLITSPILPGVPGYVEEQTNIFDVEQAKKLLNDLGFSKKEIKTEKQIDQDKNTEQITTTTKDVTLYETDASGLSKFLYKDGSEITLTLTIADHPQSIAVAELVQKYWQAIGIKTNLNIIDSKQIQKDIIAPRNFEALLFGEILGSDGDPYAFWHSSQAGENGLNLANFKNSAADELLKKAMEENDETKKADYHTKFKKILAEQIPAIFLYNPNYTYVVANKIKGINLTHIATPEDRLLNIKSWYIKTNKGFK